MKKIEKYLKHKRKSTRPGNVNVYLYEKDQHIFINKMALKYDCCKADYIRALIDKEMSEYGDEETRK